MAHKEVALKVPQGTHLRPKSRHQLNTVVENGRVKVRLGGTLGTMVMSPGNRSAPATCSSADSLQIWTDPPEAKGDQSRTGVNDLRNKQGKIGLPYHHGMGLTLSECSVPCRVYFLGQQAASEVARSHWVYSSFLTSE